MSAPSRGAGATRARSTSPPTGRGRGVRGASRSFQARGHGRGAPLAAANSRAKGLLQGLQAGTTARRGSDDGPTRGPRGRSFSIRGASTVSRGQFANRSETFSAPKPPAPTSNVDFTAQTTARFETLKQNRELERAKAIEDGFLADPDKKTTLENAITPVGTCTEMCPAFERVERIVQRMVDKSEKAREDSSKPDEERMVKRFRRSAAGYDEQLPSDIRTPATLKMTLDYLLDDIIGGEERLASIHKFVWDRTRAIRNDFSIQQVTKKEDVMVAVECLERIARFHILSLHQLSNPENLIGEQFDAHQDREQLNNTLLSLMYYYDDNRRVLDFPNEAEFRAYCIIFELQSQHPDLEDRMQSWPRAILEDGRVRTAFKLYAAAGNTIFDQGPLRPLTKNSLAQGNTGSFWSILSSKQVSYLMACVAEIYFGQVRYMALQALWTAATSAPVMTRAKNQDWTVDELTTVLGFDNEEQVVEFCEEFGLRISTKDDGVQYLDVILNKALDKSLIPSKQVFSYGIVEAKRFRRTLAAVINGKTIQQAVRQGLVETNESLEEANEHGDPADDGESSFLPEKKPVDANPFANPGAKTANNSFAKPGTSGFNPAAGTFAPSMFQNPTSKAQFSANPFAGFGQAVASTPELVQASITPAAIAPSAFPSTSLPQGGPLTAAANSTNPFSNASGNGFPSTPQSTPSKPQSQPFVFGNGGFTTTTTPANANAAPVTTKPFSFAGFASQPTSMSTTPSQPPAFSWSKAQESTQSTDSVSKPGFIRASTARFEGENANSPGTVPSQQQAEPAPSLLKKQQQPLPVPDHSTPTQHLETAGLVDTPGNSLTPDVSAATSNESTRSWLRQSSSQSIPKFSSPLRNVTSLSPGTPGASQKPSILPSIEQPNQNQLRHSTSAPAGQAKDLTPHNADQSSPFPKAHTTGYQWSDPTVPGYRNETPSAARNLKPGKHARAVVDRKCVVDALAHVAMTQDTENLMDEFTKFIVPGIIEKAIDQHNREVHAENTKIIREEYLLKKYVKRAEKAYWSKKLKRWAERRRDGFIEVGRQANAEGLRRSQSNAVADDILAVVRESARIKAEVEANLRKDREEKEPRRIAESNPKEQETAKENQAAGRKRKSGASKEGTGVRLDLAGRPYTPSHKRSKTENLDDNEQNLDKRYHHNQVRKTPPTMSAGRSLFSRTLSGYNYRLASQQPSTRSVDNTKIDYFRLKARGIDPETPVVPLTATQVEYQRQQVEAEQARRAAEPKSWQRNSSLGRLTDGLPPWGMPKLEDFEMPPPAKPLPKPVATPGKPKTASPAVQDLLDELREVRQAQEADIKWFKDQRLELEEQVEEAEQTLQVHRTIERRHGSQTSSSGLMQSQLGYEFMPAKPRPGHTLSRTEQRIRRTGAHGLATTPIGGTPGYVKPEVGHLERTLTAELNGISDGEQEGEATNGSKVAVGEESAGSAGSCYVALLAAHRASNDKGKERAVVDYSAPAYHTYSDGEELSMPNGGNNFPTGPVRNGLELDEDAEFRKQHRTYAEVLQDDEQLSREEHYEEDLDEDEIYDYEEDYDDEDEDEEQAGPSRRGQYLSATPDAGAQASRAASSGAYSGAGASADDAIDLDSD